MSQAGFETKSALARAIQLEALVWARVPGDIVFSVGVVAFALFVLQALLGKRRAENENQAAPNASEQPPF